MKTKNFKLWPSLAGKCHVTTVTRDQRCAFKRTGKSSEEEKMQISPNRSFLNENEQVQLYPVPFGHLVKFFQCFSNNQLIFHARNTRNSAPYSVLKSMTINVLN
jgi:hypothetical protein